MSTGANSRSSFQSWLAALSLDAARTDLCPNLEYIPAVDLRAKWADGCAPTAFALANYIAPRRRTKAGRGQAWKVLTVPLKRQVASGSEVALLD